MRIIEPSTEQIRAAEAAGIVMYDYVGGSLPVVEIDGDYFGPLGEKYYFSNQFNMLVEIGYGRAGYRRARVLAKIPEYPFESEYLREVYPEIAFTFFALEHDLEYLRAYATCYVRGGGIIDFYPPAILIIRSSVPGLWIGKKGWRIKRIRYHLYLGDPKRKWRIKIV